MGYKVLLARNDRDTDVISPIFRHRPDKNILNGYFAILTHLKACYRSLYKDK